MSGFGVYRFTDGFTFEGIMRNNWPFGEGIAHYANGGCYAGRWLDGKYEVESFLGCNPPVLSAFRGLLAGEIKRFSNKTRVLW